MSNSKHTPGPWTFSLENRDVVRTETKCNSILIAQLYKDSRTEANAHLIAAAPEMFEALSEAWGYVLYYVNDPNTQDKDAADVLQKMDSAIRKAKGGAK